MYLDPGDLRRDREIEKSATSNLACVVPSAALAEQWRLNGHAAALGSYTTDHGRLQASCTNSGRLPPSERSNDRSPRQRRSACTPRWAPPRACYAPDGLLGSLVLVPIGATPTVLGVCPPFLCSRRQSCRRASRRFIPPRAVSGFCPPAIPAPARVLRLSNTSVWGSWAGGVAWLHVHAHRDVLAQPLFHGRQKAAR